MTYFYGLKISEGVAQAANLIVKAADRRNLRFEDQDGRKDAQLASKRCAWCMRFFYDDRDEPNRVEIRVYEANHVIEMEGALEMAFYKDGQEMGSFALYTWANDPMSWSFSTDPSDSKADDFFRRMSEDIINLMNLAEASTSATDQVLHDRIWSMVDRLLAPSSN